MMTYMDTRRNDRSIETVSDILTYLWGVIIYLREKLNNSFCLETKKNNENSKIASESMKENLDGADEQYYAYGIPTDNRASFEEFERQKTARTLAVPTDDLRVRKLIQEEGEPQTLFGEGPEDRRTRLRDILSRKIIINKDKLPDNILADEGEVSSEEDDAQEECFYSYGTEELEKARRFISEKTFEKAHIRMNAQSGEIKVPYALRKKIVHELYARLKKYDTRGVQLGDTRPLHECIFSPNSKSLLIGGWSGAIKLWSVENFSEQMTYKVNNERVCGLDFHPGATTSQDPSTLNFVSSSVDGIVNLWALNSNKPISSLVGHELRVSKAKFHPSAKYIGTASWDTTWRLWDVETSKELLLQTGHSKELYDIGFQCDGSLAATGGADCNGIVWDLRTGRAVIVLQGHIKTIYSLSWSPNGYHICTGSEDNTIKIWDVRMANIIYTIPAHKNMVTKVHYWNGTYSHQSTIRNLVSRVISTSKHDCMSDASSRVTTDTHKDLHMDVDTPPSSCSLYGQEISNWDQTLGGCFLISSSYDGSCCIWSSGNYKLIKKLMNVESKIMSCDISRDAKYIATVSYDKYYKIYEMEDS